MGAMCCSRRRSSTKSRSNPRIRSTSSSFVERNEVDEIYLDESFYVVPNDEVAYEAFAVIREAMKKKDMVGLGRVVTHRRERLLMLQPRGKGIVATALRYKSEVRNEDTYFEEIPATRVPNDMLQLAEHILEQKRGHFDPEEFEDRYEGALKALDQGQARRQGAADRAGAEALECDQPDGRAAPQRQGRHRRGEEGAREIVRTALDSEAPIGEEESRKAQEAETRELTRGAGSLPQEAQIRRHVGAARRADQARRRRVRDPEARGAAAALRSAPRARRRDEELGGDARPEPGAGREAARRAGRGPSGRVQ